MAATGMAGAVYDPTSSQGTGALCTGIGFGCKPTKGNNLAQVVQPFGFLDAQAGTVARIGDATAAAANSMTVQDTPSAKAIKFAVTTATVAADGVVTTGFLNKTGASIPAGVGIWSVGV